MSFQPYSIFASRLQALEVGYLIKAAAKTYQVAEVRRNRFPISLTDAAEIDGKEHALTISTAHPEYAMLHGKLDVFRIIHIQYIAVTTNAAILLKFGMEPLLSRFVNQTIDNVTFPPTHPLEVNRWSYDEEQHIKYTVSAAQKLFFENMEYVVAEYTKALPKGQLMLKILPDGFARMVKVA